MASQAQKTKLARQRDQRRALFTSLSESLILHESIVTTRAKARALRPHIEKLVTKAKQDTGARRRLLRSRLHTDEATDKLFDDIAPRYQHRPGGYTRLSPAGLRRGDNTEMMRISFVESHSESAAAKPKTTTAETDETSSKEEQ